MYFPFEFSFIGAFLQVVLIDLVLAGDNAIVIGLAAAGLPAQLRRRAIFVGILAATILRILLAAVTVYLLAIIGLLFAGGLLLLWVCWKMYRELRDSRAENLAARETLGDKDLDADGKIAAGHHKPKSFRSAIATIILADLSMSLDNVLAVAGAAGEHMETLVFGLGLSVVLMGLGAALIAGLLERYRWLAYIGLAIILFVALRMIWEGGHEILVEGLHLLGRP